MYVITKKQKATIENKEIKILDEEGVETERVEASNPEMSLAERVIKNVNIIGIFNNQQNTIFKKIKKEGEEFEIQRKYLITNEKNSASDILHT